MGFNSGFKGLNAELNAICHLLVLLGAHPILHVSRIRVKIVSCRAVGTLLQSSNRSMCVRSDLGTVKVHPCTGTEALYKPYGP